MKRKLTVTIDQALIPLAKEIAQGSGKSLSGLLEDLLRQQAAKGKTSFSERWRGAFIALGMDDARRSYLMKRHA